MHTASIKARPPRRKSRMPRLLGWLVVMLLLGYWLTDRYFPVDLFRHAPPVTALHPVVAAKAAELVELSQQKGITIRITDDFRSTAAQDSLYRLGRSDPGSVVTNVKGGYSYHNYGLAIDFALELEGGKVVWDLDADGNKNGESDWMEVVQLAKQLGFTWGGDWANFPDYPHLQMDFGYSIRELRQGKRPPDSISE